MINKLFLYPATPQTNKQKTMLFNFMFTNEGYLLWVYTLVVITVIFECTFMWKILTVILIFSEINKQS